MLKMTLALFFALGSGEAQGPSNHPLGTRHIVGTVLDPDGAPLAGARIEHTDEITRPFLQSDSKGGFQLDTTAPAFVVWKSGYRGELVRTQDPVVRITLRKERRAFPICSASAPYLGDDSAWAGSLQFPRIPGVNTTNPEHLREGPGVVRYYYLTVGPPARPVQHRLDAGVLLPTEADVWQSAKYELDTFAVGGRTILDERGELPNGTRWRTLAEGRERVWYADADADIARRLDQILDGGCLNPGLH